MFTDAAGLHKMTVRSFRVHVTPPSGETAAVDLSQTSVRFGSRGGNDVVLEDAGVSRIHFEIVADQHGFRMRDLGSTNGTLIDGMRAADAYLRAGAIIRAGATDIRFEPGDETVAIDLASSDRFGPLLGASPQMRKLYALLERAAPADVTVLIEGESGTGKELVAQALHGASKRASGPYVVFDCAAIPDNLLESELFGHERGAFTGASERRIGCLEEADGGTLFLDELGELPLPLQAKLLRALENREFRRVGGQERRKVDVRFVAATNRDLAAAVNDGRFREDLYYRLAVLRVVVPPLRDRREDIPLLVRAFVQRGEADAGRVEATIASIKDEIWRSLERHRWPGNVRELRNVIQRALVLGRIDEQTSGGIASPAKASDEPAAGGESLDIDTSRAFLEQKQEIVSRFEVAYINAMLRECDNKITQAASRAAIDRSYFKRLMKKHGIKT